MTNSIYEYVRKFEKDDSIMRSTWIVVRVDGRNFSNLTKNWEKPFDARGGRLMNKCACEVMRSIGDIVFAYGHSDEFSFVFPRETTIFQRRSSKIMSTVVSLFTSNFVHYWDEEFGEPNQKTENQKEKEQENELEQEQLQEQEEEEENENKKERVKQQSIKMPFIPSFDARVIVYPNVEILRDYFSWRQVDCHINCLYNTCFYALLNDGLSNNDATLLLKDTYSSDKNELLFTRFGLNYNNVDPIERKGSLVYKKKVKIQLKRKDTNEYGTRTKNLIFVEHRDLIQDTFWNEYPHILEVKKKNKKSVSKRRQK
ncbi:tRNA(his) guanylyltransferase-related [Anaeramoeba flamelloides]|uniref:tRNA(His) guanylyltransferase n=1 Tax=Anaeramoeba flamelloides TaxID=1746091 RepID=A0ABQ8ZAJ9_9EUKA|nr:tRNA(his) guanylyltransferase-related [Anaeramoeba flamelloides]